MTEHIRPVWKGRSIRMWMALDWSGASWIMASRKHIRTQALRLDHWKA